jgi:hypothetical protein
MAAPKIEIAIAAMFLNFMAVASAWCLAGGYGGTEALVTEGLYFFFK